MMWIRRPSWSRRRRTQNAEFRASLREVCATPSKLRRLSCVCTLLFNPSAGLNRPVLLLRCCDVVAASMFSVGFEYVGSEFGLQVKPMDGFQIAESDRRGLRCSEVTMRRLTLPCLTHVI